jgi:hypothetical protein
VSTIIAIIIAAVFGLWGYHKRLYPMWAFLFNVLIAAYLAIVLTPMVLNIAVVGELAGRLGTWANAAVLLTIFGVYLALSQLLSFYYLTNTYCVSFPRFVDDFGGAFLGFVGGYITANILLFALAISPLNEHALTQKFIPDNDGRTIVKACRYISSFSLQGVDDDLIKAIEKIKASYAKRKPAEQQPPQNQDLIADIKNPDSNQVMDANAIVQQDVNNTSQQIVQEPIKLEDIKIIPADSNKMVDANTNTNTQPDTTQPAQVPPVEQNVELPKRNTNRDRKLENPFK